MARSPQVCVGRLSVPEPLDRLGCLRHRRGRIRPASCDLHCCFVLIVAFFISSTLANAGGNEQPPSLSFRGALSTDMFSPTEANPYLSIRAEFQVTITNGLWEIELQYSSPEELRGTGESCKRIPDGVRLRPTFPTNATHGLLAAQALPLHYPPPEKTPLLLCWLSLCPEPQLPILNPHHMRRFLSIAFQNVPKNQGSFDVHYLPGEARFLSELTLTNDGLSFSREGKVYPSLSTV